MDRRQFIKHSGVAATAILGGSMGTGNSAPENKKTDSNGVKNSGASVIVAGGGIAGWSAAYELMMRGFDVTVLEASGHAPSQDMKSTAATPRSSVWSFFLTRDAPTY